MEFKPKFIERYSKLTDFEKFKEYSLKFIRRSIRVNTLKISVEGLKKRVNEHWLLTQIPWCREGFFIMHKTGRRDIGNSVEHALGYIYVQEATSMIPVVALQPKPGEIVLDMCSSPGSKATQIAAMMENKGVLITNDYKYGRLKPLSINLQRCGVANAVVTLMAGQQFGRLNLKFDKILLDAPCSGTGSIRKSIKTLQMWSPNAVKRLAIIQKTLMRSAFECLKDNGVLVYSTCSLEPEENEGIIDCLLQKYKNAKLENIKLDIKRSPAVESFEGVAYSDETKKCLRIWPQDNDTCGFFVARIRKIGL